MLTFTLKTLKSFSMRKSSNYDGEINRILE